MFTQVSFSQTYECKLVRTINDIVVEEKTFYHGLNSETSLKFLGVTYDFKLETLKEGKDLDFYVTIEKLGKEIIYYTEFSLESEETSSFNLGFISNGFSGECNCELFVEEEAKKE